MYTGCHVSRGCNALKQFMNNAEPVFDNLQPPREQPFGSLPPTFYSTYSMDWCQTWQDTQYFPWRHFFQILKIIWSMLGWVDPWTGASEPKTLHNEGLTQTLSDFHWVFWLDAFTSQNLLKACQIFLFAVHIRAFLPFNFDPVCPNLFSYRAFSCTWHVYPIFFEMVLQKTIYVKNVL